ncbi:MAG: qbdA [Hydrocarboniphaga sp.]|uniref:PQQ-dependent dehydrogenase, methanol/ethanol family n=1 Tax=Hydrocarboniphaga sp. TaxID=2033016 RepID=UPI00261873F9|nr:PQQ-dependent dehydrogenase, methanol/ethanol family [Hydrocarboniphaga sp.]MDB5972540.1 qbdA [Hydrocarboniphaga sp.]
MRRKAVTAAMAATLLCICVDATAASKTEVDSDAVTALEQGGSEWLSIGRGYSEQRYAPIEQINAGNAGKLGLAWFLDLANDRGLESTPLYSDGVLYGSLAWSRPFAVDARSGTLLWLYDPKVDKSKARRVCCDSVNRGVALWKGKVFIGTLDGRLIALDARSGKPVWQQQTTDAAKPYTITGAPRVVKGKVIIGNSGAEYGVRGYFSAYDADTGRMAWRFYTVPGDPSKPYEQPELAEAAKTWKGGQYWRYGGGGTVWDGMAYDPELDLLYVGTGNGSPWNREVRSPGGGDNLFLSSILAVHPDTGKLAWHYQETPGESWDFTATQQITLADITINGQMRKVLMQAPKNGFFYVLDRKTGKLLSAEKYGKVTWAERVDLATGRPVEAPGVRYENKPIVMWPGSFGAHSWMPMSYSPKTGLVYIPYQEVPGAYRNEGASFEFKPGGFNTGTGFADASALPREATSGALVAWDPARQREAWRVPYPTYWNGGTLATAGNLVFQGRANGQFVAYAADTGSKLWEFDAQTGIIAGAMSYRQDGEQYVAVLAGWGGGIPLVGGDASLAPGVRNISRLLVFKLGGKAQLPPLPSIAAPTRLPIPDHAHDSAALEQGRTLYHQNCGVCHGLGAVSGGVIPDLRHSPIPRTATFDAVVLKGALQSNGMPSFAGVITAEQLTMIQAYVLDAASKEAAPKPAP